MSRLKRHRNMDALINMIEGIKKSQCSLSEQDLIVLNDVIAKLQRLKKKKGLTDKHLKQEVTEIVLLFLKFLSPNLLK